MNMNQMENSTFCQSCGMPLSSEEVRGTNEDGGKNQEYCVYCYEGGRFTSDVTMEEMIEQCLKYGGDSGMFADQAKARETMRAWFPTLKRWNRA
ncbi:zinc ribbon domain-containing protein [Paenibacillus phocaensis]|uniref:zinc ribbon domain-containing protein n=1 Tax=Paenibacillus phocaensis TaxID=1776378 RepID=UPI0003A74CD9|nr:zinc ribbon domain-containing protein [Paenibacillus phocaensis]